MKTIQLVARAGFLLALALQISLAMDGVNQPGCCDSPSDTPEPGTITLVAIGFAAGGYALYRKRRNGR
jgi:hypothetical protein